MFDIHSHILPNIDDGAENIQEALDLLNLLKEDGVTKVLATPHFYPQDTNLEEYLKLSKKIFQAVKKVTENKELPEIFLGCELLYYDSIGMSEAVSNLCLNNSKYLLLELTDNCINNKLYENILLLKTEIGITPIIAHIERYYRAKEYKKFLKFISENNIPVQINATSFFMPMFKRPLKRLLNCDIFIVLGSDTHSVDARPPKISEALKFIEKKYGLEIKEKIIRNSNLLCSKITDSE